VFERLCGLLRLEGKLDETIGGLGKLRALAAGGMVIVSILSAFAVLAASVYDDEASQHDGVYRQQLLTREATAHSHEEEVTRDLAVFGNYEQHVDRARDLRAAARAGDPARAEALRARAERELAIGAALRHDFRVIPPKPGGRAGPGYNPDSAYWTATHTVGVLHDEVEPAPLRVEARNARQNSVGMALAAALFLGALLFFTLAQIWVAKKLAKAARTEWPPIPTQGPLLEVEPSVRRGAYLLFACATALSLGGLVLGLGIAI
jgi:hypothetical protein